MCPRSALSSRGHLSWVCASFPWPLPTVSRTDSDELRKRRPACSGVRSVAGLLNGAHLTRQVCAAETLRGRARLESCSLNKDKAIESWFHAKSAVHGGCSNNSFAGELCTLRNSETCETAPSCDNVCSAGFQTFPRRSKKGSRGMGGHPGGGLPGSRLISCCSGVKLWTYRIARTVLPETLK